MDCIFVTSKHLLLNEKRLSCPLSYDSDTHFYTFKNKARMNLVHGSLFSGLDAPSVAASWMGWKNAFHCEINPFCNVILNYWFPESEHYEDITKETP